MNGTLIGTTSVSGVGSNSNIEIFQIPQNARTGASSSDRLVSYLGHSLGIWHFFIADIAGVFYVPAD